MASINGVSVKHVSFDKDEDGCIVYSGLVYVDGKKAGHMEQDKFGGPNHYDIPNGCFERIKERAADFAHALPDNEDVLIWSDPDVFLHEIILLSQTEILYEKYVKKGFPILLTVQDGVHTALWPILKEQQVTKDDVEKMFEKMYANVTPQYGVWKSSKDFEIIADANHPITKDMYRRLISRQDLWRQKNETPWDDLYLETLKAQGKTKKINVAVRKILFNEISVEIPEDEYNEMHWTGNNFVEDMPFVQKALRKVRDEIDYSQEATWDFCASDEEGYLFEWLYDLDDLNGFMCR